MKKRLVIGMILVLALPSLACSLLTGKPRANPTRTPLTASTVVATLELKAPTIAAPTPAPAEPTSPSSEAPTQAAVPTFTEVAPSQEPTFLPLVPTATTGETASQSVVDKVTLARDAQGEDKHPVNPTTVFAPGDVIHAVVHLNDAPANTKVTATWYVVDVGSAAAPNSAINTTDITTEGTRYVDFTLSPQGKWPTGSYKVTIALNGQVVETAEYTVQ